MAGLILYQLRPEWVGRFAGGVASLGDERQLDVAAALTAGNGTITASTNDGTLIGVLDTLPVLMRTGAVAEGPEPPPPPRNFRAVVLGRDADPGEAVLTVQRVADAYPTLSVFTDGTVLTGDGTQPPGTLLVGGGGGVVIDPGTVGGGTPGGGGGGTTSQRLPVELGAISGARQVELLESDATVAVTCTLAGAASIRFAPVLPNTTVYVDVRQPATAIARSLALPQLISAMPALSLATGARDLLQLVSTDGLGFWLLSHQQSVRAGAIPAAGTTQVGAAA